MSPANFSSGFSPLISPQASLSSPGGSTSDTLPLSNKNATYTRGIINRPLSANSYASSMYTGVDMDSVSSSRRGSWIPGEGTAPTASERYRLPTTKLPIEDAPEPDDYLHDPSTKRLDDTGTIFTTRGFANIGFLLILIGALLMLFMGYPIIAFAQSRSQTLGAFNLGGVNGSGQVAATIGNFGLIDNDTPTQAFTRKADNGDDWQLVFSDEFEVDGRTFWPGDDPFFEAIDLHAWATNDLEYYDPRAISTKDGKMSIELTKRPSHGLNYTGGSVQSWNKFCFTGGRLEASVRLPAKASVFGLWPAFWTMGNLGRVGYGGTLEGLWPYTYDSCDYGTLPNQTLNDEPKIALTSGTWIGDGLKYPKALSYLPGQRLSRCTCENDSTHPGPKHSDGSWVGRGAPEIDVFEAQVDTSSLIGQVSQSGQWAPFTPDYVWENTTHGKIEDSSISHLNSYQGGNMQQTSSIVSNTNQDCYEWNREGNPGCFSVYAIEYKTGEKGYIKWFTDDKLIWTYTAGGFPAIPEAKIGERIIPEEPMYILFNLAMSYNFGAIDMESLESLWPVHMDVEYVRVYQDPALKNIGCDPVDHPTADYIARFPEGYTNPNITTWEQMTSDMVPGNQLLGQC